MLKSKGIMTNLICSKNIPHRIGVSSKSYHYTIDDSTAMSSSHEIAKNNPILQKTWVKNPIKNSFQHPLVGRITCDQPECSTRVCDKPCGTVLERVYVGHVTHSNKYGVFISYYDFNKKQNVQYFVPYIYPVKNDDVSGDNINHEHTENLNTTNKEARDMIHIYSSQEKSIDDLP